MATESEARRLVGQARALIDDDLMAGRENFLFAAELCQKAVALDPADGQVWAISARVAGAILDRNYDTTPQQRELFRSLVERAARLAPNSVETALARASLMRRNREWAGAEQVLRAADPSQSDFRVQSNLANLLLTLPDRTSQHVAESLQIYRRWQQVPATRVEALLEEANFHWGEGNLVDAEQLVAKAQATTPSRDGYLLQLLLIGYGWSDLPAAKIQIDQLPPGLMQEDVFASLVSGLWLRLGDGAQALEVLNRMPRDFIGENRQFLPKSLRVGWAHFISGKPLAAAAEWKQGLRVVDERLQSDPNRAELLRWRAQLLALVGEKEAALAAWRLFEESMPPGRTVSPLTAIEFHCALGNRTAAMDLLKSMDQADGRGSNLRLQYDPSFALIRDEPETRRYIAETREHLAQLRARGPVGESLLRPAPAPVTQGSDKSVAVLAFANLSEDKANEYFSDGISEELLNVLAKVPGLKVSARTSAFYFKGRNTPIREIAQQLGVAYVVEGSVRRSGDRVRITAQLIKAADGFRVWNDTFTRDLQDIFAVQDEIAGLIAKSLSLQLGASPARKLPPVNPQAFELYVQARQSWSLRTAEGFSRAEQMLNRALALAPDFVRARAALIDVVQMRSLRQRNVGTFGTRHSPEIEQRLAEVRAVLAIDPDMAEAYSTLGQALDSQWRRDEAGQAYRRATELNPNYATGRHWYGMHLAERGLMDEALAELKAACDLDPFSFIILDNYGWLLNLAGRRSEALQLFDRAAALNPGFDQTARVKAAALAALGRRTEAEAIARQLKNNQRELDVWTLGTVGLQAEAKALLDRMDPRDVSNRFQALLSAGERDAAMDALTDPSGASKGDSIDLLYHPIFDPIRNDPRFIRYLAVLGIAEAHARAQAWRRANPPEEARGGQ